MEGGTPGTLPALSIVSPPRGPRPLAPANTSPKQQGRMGRYRKDFFNQMALKKVDWLFLLVLILVFGLIEYIAQPVQWFISPDDYQRLMYPRKENTVPSWTVPLIALSPLALVVIAAIWPAVLGNMRAREVHDLVLGILMNIAITGSITSTLKVSVGRPRPDFLSRCFPKANHEELTEFAAKGGIPDCTGEKEIIKDGLKSFPSGHSSWTMCSMMFLTFLLLGKLSAFDGRGELWRMVTSFLPIGVAVGVGVTRITDYRHHYSDVLAGFAIGALVALLVYYMYYPWPLHRKGMELPLSLLQESKGLPLSVPALSQDTSMLGSLDPLQIPGTGIPAV